MAAGLAPRLQPAGQVAIAGMVDDVLANQFAYDLRWSEILLGTDFLEQFFLLRIDEQGQTGSAALHDAPLFQIVVASY